MTYERTVHAKAIELTKLSIEMTTGAGSGHPSSATSLAHLVTVLLYDHMRFEPERPEHPAADRLVLSEGHACPILYAAAADLGIAIRTEAKERPMTREDAMRLREIGSAIDGHPNPEEGFPFFPAATGSLGQGLSIAAGIALAARMDEIEKSVFCIVGDGESREGQIWEALDFIVEHDLQSVLPIFNCNALGQTGAVSRQQASDVLEKKLDAFGFETEVIDGHDPNEILRCLNRHAGHQNLSDERPLALVVKTVKGWGTPSLQGEGCHGQALQGEAAERALAELAATARELEASFTEGELSISPIAAAVRDDVTVTEPVIPTLREALHGLDRDEVLEAGKLAPRKAFGLALRMLAHAHPGIVALDGDVGNSTYTDELERDADLRDRFVQCRIAEQNMISVAAGLCSAGKIPFVASFGKFLTRAYDQLEMALVSGFPMRLVGSHVGVSLAADGPSQMALTDVAFFRSLGTVTRQDGSGPMMHVVTPADAFAAYALTQEMVSHDGACYLRTIRPDVPFLYDDDTVFEIGGHRVISSGEDVLLAASGYMVHEALAARDRLEATGVSAGVVDLYSLPFDEAAFTELARESSGRVVTLEDNFGGGLGSAVAEALQAAEGVMELRQMRVRRMPKSGRTPADVLQHLGLSRDDVFDTAMELVQEG